MMRKLTATGLAALTVAGVAGTGAAFAASSHAPKPHTGVVASDTSSKERHSTDKLSKESSTRDRSHETSSSDRAVHHEAESGR